MRTFTLAVTLWLAALAQAAAAPRVVADIAPVEALVAMVMDGAGTPDRLLPPDADPHHTALRPSQASALARAEVVITLGGTLTPWLEEAVARAAPDEAPRLSLMEVPGTTLLPVREGPVFGTAETHAEAEHAEDEHAEAEHHEDDHAAEDGHGHDTHASDVDTHAWLDPANGRLWLGAIAETLGRADPRNADLYARNAEQAAARIAAAAEEAAAILEGDPPAYAVAHDSIGYFEAAFGVPAAGALTGPEAHAAGPRRTEALQSLIREGRVACILGEPGEAEGQAQALARDTRARVASIDSMGANTPGAADRYPEILLGLARTLDRCRAAAS